MNRARNIIFALAVAGIIGCQAKPKATPGNTDALQSPFVPPGSTLNSLISNNDPSANKMHDIEGGILNYYLLNKKLPEKFDEIKALADADAPIDQNCPGSKLPYIYTPDGIKLQDREARIVLYEPEPLHKGYRLCVIFSEPQDKKPLMTDLIALPESFFLLRPPGTGAAERLPPPDPQQQPVDAAQLKAPRGLRH